MAVALPAWVLASFYLAQALVATVILGLRAVGISLQVSTNEAIENSLFAVIIYSLTILIVIGVPYLIRHTKVSLKELGVRGWPTWADLLLAPAGLFIYLIASSLLLIFISTTLPTIDLNQAQDTGFNNIAVQYEYILAFVTLVIIAPIAEEVLFRGYLFGLLKRYVPVWVAVVVSSVLFGAVHGSWNVAIDTFALGVVLCILREVSGTIYPSILLHMLKNGIAFYLLFINPLFLHTLGG